MSQVAGHPKRFAPLHPEKGKQSKAPKLKGVVFDVDGTLWYNVPFITVMLSLSVSAVYQCRFPIEFTVADTLKHQVTPSLSKRLPCLLL